MSNNRRIIPEDTLLKSQGVPSYERRAAARLARLPQQPLVLGIETSCDETAAAVVQGQRTLLSNCVVSQIDLHKQFGGVVPEEASRLHVEALLPVVDEALAQAGVSLADLSAIGVTNRPGLMGALLTGLSCAKALALAVGLPLIGVHHIEGHLCAAYLSNPDLVPPFVGLAASGGHTHLYLARDYGDYVLLGHTVDDAAGEALDKAARLLGLPYPGGPNLERLAQGGDAAAYTFSQPFNHSAQHSNFSFSGLKTALATEVQALAPDALATQAPHLAAAFQSTVANALCCKTVRAALAQGVTRVVLCGGVAANGHLRQRMREECAAHGLTLHLPPMAYCTDNAAMIACAAAQRLALGQVDSLALAARSTAPLGH